MNKKEIQRNLGLLMFLVMKVIEWLYGDTHSKTYC